MSNNLQSGFDGASLKVERAYRHIDELKAVITEISSRKTDSLTVTDQPDGRHSVRLASFGGAGSQIPLIIGDAIHNLRAAFDHLWLALHRTTSDTGKPYFPFEKTREDLKKTISKSPVTEAFPDVERLIIDCIKPHSDAGGNHLLWTITKFDNIDKHNLIIPAIFINNIRGDFQTKSGGVTVDLGNNKFIGNVILHSSNNPVEYKQKGVISLEVTFPEDDLLPGEPVVPALINMAEAASKAVQLFRKTFL